MLSAEERAIFREQVERDCLIRLGFHATKIEFVQAPEGFVCVSPGGDIYFFSIWRRLADGFTTPSLHLVFADNPKRRRAVSELRLRGVL